MAYQKHYRTVIPILHEEPVDEAVVVWLARESFDRKAAGDSLVINEFVDKGTVDPADIPPKAEKQLGRAATEYVWRAFEGVGVRA